ncbi:hypothetical protein [Sporomusa aerivorans]|uniref:hypothetical protein n=1 Tax=Sporomusa aerivorans TaxID=204936 RepID=UPI00352B81DE
MNKIKVLYDVVKTMKAKEVLAGVLKAEAEKDQTTIFSIQNEFEKTMLTKQTKVKMTAEWDCDSRPAHQHERPEGFTTPFFADRKHHEFSRINHQQFLHNDLKGKLSKLAFALSLLDSLQVEEHADKSITLSLETNDLPDDIKLLWQERLSQRGMHHHGRHSFLKEFCSADGLGAKLVVSINQHYEIEKIVLTAAGTQTDTQAMQHALTANAELSFIS